MSDVPRTVACRTVYFVDRRVVILLQDLNGPCPILALFNALALRGVVSIPQNAIAHGAVPSSVVTNAIASVAMQRSENLSIHVNNREYLVADMLDILPRLWNGMDLNVHLDNVRSYEPTREVSLFELCGVPLVHGWLMGGDVDDGVVAEVKGRAYNAMVVAVSEGEAPLFDAWSARHATQLTPVGLERIRDELANNLPVVFFRNNHYSTLIRHGPTLYVLVTDVGISRAQPAKPWESLSDVAGALSAFAALWTERALPALPAAAVAPRRDPPHVAFGEVQRGQQPGTWGGQQSAHAPYHNVDDESDRCWCRVM